MRDVKRLNPGVSVALKYDAVEVGGNNYVYHQEEGRVIQSDQVPCPDSLKYDCSVLQYYCSNLD